MLYFLIITKKAFAVWAIFIIAGSTSNIIDRLIYGGVVDYLNILKLISFNISDLVIILGISALAITFIGEYKTPS